MSEDTTLEERKRCPKCGVPGLVVSTLPIPQRPGAKLITMKCMNGTKDEFGPTLDSCRWFLTGWLIQINPDGSIPSENTARNMSNRDKAFPQLRRPNTNDEERIVAAIQKQLEQETKQAGGEVRRRNY